MRVTFEAAFQALPPSLHRHCTDEAQKAETVLSAVIYIYIYVYVYIYIYMYMYMYMYIYMYIYLAIILRGRAGYEMIYNQRGA